MVSSARHGRAAPPPPGGAAAARSAAAPFRARGEAEPLTVQSAEVAHVGETLERFPTRWHHLVEKKALQLKDLSIVFPLGPMRSERAML